MLGGIEPLGYGGVKVLCVFKSWLPCVFLCVCLMVISVWYLSLQPFRGKCVGVVVGGAADSRLPSAGLFWRRADLSTSCFHASPVCLAVHLSEPVPLRFIAVYP